MEIVIPVKVFQKVMHWVNKSDNEVSGFGKVILDKETNTFRVLDAHLVEQENGSVTTDIDDKALGKLMFLTKDAPGELRWWWHSHVNMGTAWSGTDLDTIRELGGQGWIIASVFNKREEVRSAICYRYTFESAFGAGTSIHLDDDLETNIESAIDEEEIRLWDLEYETNVKEKRYFPDSWRKNDKPIHVIGEQGELVPISDDEIIDYGYLGYGLEKEAKALGISTAKYKQILEKGTQKELLEIEDELYDLEREGKLEVIQ